MKKYRGQIWVETVIYVLIALVLIAAVLAFARPKIDEMKDKAVIENSLNLLKELDNILSEMKGAAGNQRTPTVKINDGFLEIRGVEDEIYFEFDGKYKYSEPGKTVNYGGDINVTTIKRGDIYKIKIVKSYVGVYNITFTDKDINKRLEAGAVPYSLLITNNGYDPTKGGVLMDFQVK